MVLILDMLVKLRMVWIEFLFVTSIPLPRFKDLHLNLIQFMNCSLGFTSGSDSLEDSLSVAIRKWCAKVVPYMEHLKKKKHFMERLHGLLEEDLYAALPELKPHVVTKSRHRSHRGFSVLLSALSGLITLAVESINSNLNRCQEKHSSCSDC